MSEPNYNYAKKPHNTKDVIHDHPMNVKIRENNAEEDTTTNEFFDNPNSINKPIKVENSMKNYFYLVITFTTIVLILFSA